MPDEFELFAAYMAHPDTNKQVVAALLDDCMADSDYAGAMKVQKALWRETDERS